MSRQEASGERAALGRLSRAQARAMLPAAVRRWLHRPKVRRLPASFSSFPPGQAPFLGFRKLLATAAFLTRGALFPRLARTTSVFPLGKLFAKNPRLPLLDDFLATALVEPPLLPFESSLCPSRCQARIVDANSLGHGKEDDPFVIGLAKEGQRKARFFFFSLSLSLWVTWRG